MHQTQIEKFYIDNRRRLVNTMARRCRGDRAMAEDVVQEAFTRALSFINSYDEECGSFNSWFNTILYNTLFDMRRRERPGPHTEVEELCVADVISGINNQSEAMSELIQSEIASIKNPKHQRLLTLFFIYGYTSKEISLMMEQTTQTMVTTNVMRFKEKLI